MKKHLRMKSSMKTAFGQIYLADIFDYNHDELKQWLIEIGSANRYICPLGQVAWAWWYEIE